jgi:hypothetical protein
MKSGTISLGESFPTITPRAAACCNRTNHISNFTTQFLSSAQMLGPARESLHSSVRIRVEGGRLWQAKKLSTETKLALLHAQSGLPNLTEVALQRFHVLNHAGVASGAFASGRFESSSRAN